MADQVAADMDRTVERLMDRGQLVAAAGDQIQAIAKILTEHLEAADVSIMGHLEEMAHTRETHRTLPDKLEWPLCSGERRLSNAVRSFS